MKRTRPFVREKSGSLIMHENVHFLGEKKFSKLNRIFPGQMEAGFRKNTSRTITVENLSKIGTAVLEILSFLGFWACPGKSTRKSGNYENFFQMLQMAQFEKLTIKKRFLNTFTFTFFPLLQGALSPDFFLPKCEIMVSSHFLKFD